MFLGTHVSFVVTCRSFTRLPTVRRIGPFRVFQTVRLFNSPTQARNFLRPSQRSSLLRLWRALILSGNRRAARGYGDARPSLMPLCNSSRVKNYGSILDE